MTVAAIEDESRAQQRRGHSSRDPALDGSDEVERLTRKRCDQVCRGGMRALGVPAEQGDGVGLSSMSCETGA